MVGRSFYHLRGCYGLLSEARGKSRLGRQPMIELAAVGGRHVGSCTAAHAGCHAARKQQPGSPGLHSRSYLPPLAPCGAHQARALH